MNITQDISRIVREYGNVTHILTVFIETTDNNNKNQILDSIYQKINKTEIIVKRYQRNDIFVTWQSFDKIHYYTNSLYYNDIGIKNHTRIMMQDLVDELRQTYTFEFTVKYLVTKPLSRPVVL